MPGGNELKEKKEMAGKAILGKDNKPIMFPKTPGKLYFCASDGQGNMHPRMGNAPEKLAPEELKKREDIRKKFRGVFVKKKVDARKEIADLRKEAHSHLTAREYDKANAVTDKIKMKEAAYKELVKSKGK